MNRNRTSSDRMSVEDFVFAVVEAHARGDSIVTLARRIKKSPMTVYLRHYWLRREGVPLPSLPMKKPTVQERALVALAEARDLHGV